MCGMLRVLSGVLVSNRSGFTVITVCDETSESLRNVDKKTKEGFVL